MTRPDARHLRITRAASTNKLAEAREEGITPTWFRPDGSNDSVIAATIRQQALGRRNHSAAGKAWIPARHGNIFPSYCWTFIGGSRELLSGSHRTMTRISWPRSNFFAPMTDSVREVGCITGMR